MMATNNLPLFTLCFLSNLLLFCSFTAQANHPNVREALEIIIGGGGGGYSNPSPPPEQSPVECPPPPPPPCPPPPIPHPPIHPPPSPSPPPPSPPPPSPPPPSPPPPSPRPKSSPPQRAVQPPAEPSPFENARIEKAFYVIREFNKAIIDDPLHVTKTWVGRKVCKYKGFVCSVPPDAKGQRSVAGVNFNGFRFRGYPGKGLALDKLINDLSDITLFHANSNFFTGTVPKINTQLLRYFYELDLSNNKLSGGFPNEVLEATNLTFIDLRFNHFTGPIRSELFKLDVNVIFINNNDFTGRLPDNFGSTPAAYLTFANNKFQGPIPKSIGQAKKTLIEVLFLNNQFEGCLPYEIGFLEKATLFDVSQNWLTGPIPHSFACLDSILVLNLADNHFYGAVPELVCKLPQLVNFTLRNNYFTQVGPECRKLIGKKILDVSGNCILDLPNQKSKEHCAEFFSKPKYCAYEKSLNYIPCKKYYRRLSSLNESADGFEEKVVEASAIRSYAALKPH